MAFVRHPVTQDDSLGRVLVVADADGSNQRQLATHSAPGMFLTDGFTEGGPNRPVWSPDGSAIALLRLPQPGVLNEVVVLDSTTGTERQVRTIDGAFLSELAWLDESRLLVNRHDVKGGPFQIWVLDLHTGASTPLTRDVSDYRGVTLRADREVAVSTISDTRAGVWLGGPAGEDMRLALQETAANPRGLSFDRNGRLAYEASTDTGRGIWTVRPGLEDLQFVVGGGRWPALTPDGRLVYAADGRNSTGQGLWVRNADGSQSTRLVEEGILPAVAPDGDTVYFISTASGSQNLWSVRLTGGAPQRVSNRFVSNAPRISPDGRRVMFQSQNGPNPALVVCDLPHCDKEITRDFAGALFRFAPDGRSVAYLSRNNTTNIWIQPVAGGLAHVFLRRSLLSTDVCGALVEAIAKRPFEKRPSMLVAFSRTLICRM
jgi:Tol biopolymer transport system component